MVVVRHGGHAHTHAGHGATLHAGHRVCHAGTHAVGHGHGAHHVGHVQPARRVHRRHFCRHAGARCQGAAGVAAAVDGLGKHGVGPVVLRPHQHVVGFGRGDAQFVHRHRFHVLPVGGHHRQLQARDTQVEDAHGRAVDDTQAHGFAPAEQPGPVAAGRHAVEQVGVGGAAHVGQVGRAHAHLVPHAAFVHRLLPAPGRHVAGEIRGGGPVAVVVVALLFQVAEDGLGRLVGPVGQQQHMLAVGRVALLAAGMDDDGAVYPRLFLVARMAVVPVGAALFYRKPVGEGLARCDAAEAQARHTVHVRRHQQAVPVQRGGFGQPVVHPQGDTVALAPMQHRCRHAAVDGRGGADRTGEVDGQFADEQVEIGARQPLRRGRHGHGKGLCPGKAGHHAQAGQHAAGGHAGDEAAACRTRQQGGVWPREKQGVEHKNPVNAGSARRVPGMRRVPPQGAGRPRSRGASRWRPGCIQAEMGGRISRSGAGGA